MNRGIRVVSERVYEGIAQVISEVDANGPQGAQLPDVVIDDTIGGHVADEERQA